MSLASFTGARKALIASIALGALFSGHVAACEPYTEPSTTPISTTPTTSTGGTSAVSLSATVNPFTNTDWLNGIWRKSAGFSIPNSTANKAAFVTGASVKFADGQVRKVTKVYVNGANISVYTDGAILDGNKVGHPKSVSTVAATSSTSTSTSTTSTTTTTAPSTSTSTTTSTSTAGVIATTNINNFTGTDWLNGVWRKSAGFSLPGTSANKAAFKVGAKVKAADGQVRTIKSVYLVGANMSIYLDGAVLDGNVVGYPKTLSAVN